MRLTVVRKQPTPHIGEQQRRYRIKQRFTWNTRAQRMTASRVPIRRSVNLLLSAPMNA